VATSDRRCPVDRTLTSTRRFSARPALARSVPLVVLAHRTPVYDMPDGHAALLGQISDHRFSAVPLSLVSCAAPAGRFITHYLDDVPSDASSGLRQLLQFFLV